MNALTQTAPRYDMSEDENPTESEPRTPESPLEDHLRRKVEEHDKKIDRLLEEISGNAERGGTSGIVKVLSLSKRLESAWDRQRALRSALDSVDTATLEVHTATNGWHANGVVMTDSEGVAALLGALEGACRDRITGTSINDAETSFSVDCESPEDVWAVEEVIQSWYDDELKNLNVAHYG